jgi:ribosomal protein S12 methylthiotransferase
MRRPARGERTLERIRRWRRECPDLAIRSSFIVGFPGETEEDFSFLLDWLKEARINRLGCFRYENVDGARSNALPGHVPEEVVDERFHRLMTLQQQISAGLLAEKVGRTIDVLIDEVDEERAVGRSHWDAPEIDGSVFLDGARKVKPGDVVRARVVGAEEYDLIAEPQ